MSGFLGRGRMIDCAMCGIRIKRKGNCHIYCTSCSMRRQADAAKERVHKWQKINRVRYNELQQRWYKANTKKSEESSRRWREKNPEKVRMIKMRANNSRRGAPGSFTGNELKTKFKILGNKCVHCGTEDNLTVDHIRPLKLGGTNNIDNIQSLCKSCNSRKGARFVG